MSGPDAACPVCNWSISQQSCCRYSSHSKLSYGVSTCGVWSLGPDVILKERPNSPPLDETLNVEHLRRHTTIPARPPSQKELGRRGQWILCPHGEDQGPNARRRWLVSSTDAKERIADQVGESMRQLRSLQSSQMQSFVHSPIYCNWLFRDGMGAPHGPFNSDVDIWNAVLPALCKLPPAALARFKNRFPPCEPYTFTQANLCSCNIIVKDGNLAAIIDWERWGYFPSCWEYAVTFLGNGEEDTEWKAALRK